MAKAEWDAWYDDIRRTALSRSPSWLYSLIPGGAVKGQQFEAAGIMGGAGRSLKINLSGDKPGSWKDWSSGERGGYDLISLYARIKGIEYKDAAVQLAEEWNIAKPKPLRVVGTWTPITPIPADAPVGPDGYPEFTPAPNSEITGRWTYFDHNGGLIAFRIRIETPKGKDILPLTWCRNSDTGEMAWRVKDLPAPRSLYGVEWFATAEDAPLLIVSGEKTADAARALLPEWLVVTNPGGDNRVATKHTDWSPVIGYKGRRVIWPDNDDSGIRGAAEIAKIIGDCEVVRPDPAWRQGWDLADAAAEGWDGARVVAYLDSHRVVAEKPARERPECDISGSDLETRTQSLFQGIAQVDGIGDAPTLFRTDSGAAQIAIMRGNIRLAADIPTIRQWLTSRLKLTTRTREGNTVPITPGDTLLENLLVYHPSPLPLLRRVVNRPVFTAQGELILEEGYHRESGILYRPPDDLRGVAPRGTVESALALIEDLFCDFNFERPSDKAHLFALLLQPMFRETIDGPTPLYRFEAPQPGTGKTLLFETCAKLLFESGFPFITAPGSDEEWSKALLGHLMNAPEALLLDNCHDLRSQHLAAALTAWPYWTGRVLYKQGSFHVPVRNLWAATINNPEFSEEIYRRTVRIRIVPGDTERPETREGFRHDPILEYVVDSRRELTEALLTLALTAQARMRPFTGRRLGSYEAWARTMGGVLEALGIEHFLEREEDDMAEDRQEVAWREFVTVWSRELGSSEFRVRDLLETAKQTDLYLGAGADQTQQQRLGRLLMAHRGKISGGLRVVAARDSHSKSMRYRLESVISQAQTQSAGYEA